MKLSAICLLIALFSLAGAMPLSQFPSLAQDKPAAESAATLKIDRVVTANFPRVTVYAEVIGKFPGEGPEILENGAAGANLAITRGIREGAVALCPGLWSGSTGAESHGNDLEEAQNLSFHAFSTFPDGLTYLVRGIGESASKPIAGPTSASGQVRAAVFGLSQSAGEALYDSLAEVAREIEGLPGIRAILYLGAGRDISASGQGLSSTAPDTLGAILAKAGVSIYFINTAKGSPDPGFLRAVETSGGRHLEGDGVPALKQLEAILAGRMASTARIDYDTPSPVKDGMARNLEVRAGSLSAAATFFAPLDKSGGAGRLIISSVTDGGLPYPCKYRVFSEGKKISSGDMGKDGVAILDGLDGTFDIEADDGVYGLKKGSIEIKGGRDATVVFEFRFGRVNLWITDQFGGPLDADFSAEPGIRGTGLGAMPSGPIKGKTGADGREEIHLLPGEYSLKISSSGEEMVKAISVDPGTQSEIKVSFTRKNFTLSAVDLNGFPVGGAYRVSRRGSIVREGTLSLEGRELFDLPKGNYECSVSYLGKTESRNFTINPGEISGVTVKFPLYPVELSAKGPAGISLDAEVRVIDTVQTKVIDVLKTGKTGKVMTHLMKGTYKFVFMVGEGFIEKFETVKDSRIYHVDANFGEAPLTLLVTGPRGVPMDGWYQAEAVPSGLKAASGSIPKGGFHVRLPAGKYKVLLKRDILDSHTIIREVDLGVDGARAEARYESSLKFSARGPEGKPLDKGWFTLYSLDSRGKETQIQEGRLEPEGREFTLYPGSYRVIVKPTPFAKFKTSSDIDLVPEGTGTFEADLSAVIELRATIVDSPSKPVFKIHDSTGKEELDRGEIDGGSARVIVPPGKYRVFLGPYPTHPGKIDKTIDVASGSVEVVEGNFKLDE